MVKSDHQVFLRWRYQLTDYEKDTLLPILVDRLKGFKEIFEEMKVIVNKSVDDPVLIASVEAVLNLNCHQTQGDFLPAVKVYCNEVLYIIEHQFLKTIFKIEQLAHESTDFRSFSKFIIHMNILCGMISQCKTKLFLLSLKPFAVLTNLSTKAIVTTEPVEYSMILRPFDILIENLNQIALGTEGTIQDWSNKQLEWKTQYLSFMSNESNKKNNSIILVINIITVILAISLSCLFIFVNDFWGYHKEISELKYEKFELERKFNNSEAEINKLKRVLTLKNK